MRPRAAQRHAGIDLLRAVAILWVMAYHLDSESLPLPGLARSGWMGVDLFFVLSGYLIGWQVLRGAAQRLQPSWRAFFARRAWRILPAYLTVLALYLAVPAWREDAAMAPLWQFLTFTANIFPDYAHRRAFSHAWSLCVEEHFYLLLPVAVSLLARKPSARRVVACALALVAGGMLLRGWAWWYAVGPAVDSGGNGILAYVEKVYNPTWNRLDGLLVGVMLAATRALRPRWWTWIMARGALWLGAALAGVALCMALDFTSLAGAVLGFPLLSASLGALLCAALSDRFAPRRWRGARPIATLAFSLYLTHKQVFHWIDAREIDALGEYVWLALAVKLAAASAVATLLYLAVERPALRYRGSATAPAGTAA